MHRLRTFALAVATAALVVSAFGAPAAAAFGKGSIAVVNGRPGPKLDICIGNLKIRRNLPYGGKTFRQLPMGDKVLRAYLANGQAKCGGTKVAQYPFSLADGGDYTFVVTRKSPNKVVVYDNLGFGSVQPIGPRYPYVAIPVLRTAADLAAINVYYRIWQPTPDTSVGPSVNPIWVKGDSMASPSSLDWEWQVRATFPDKPRSIAVAKRQRMDIGRRYEWILVGTSGKNARWVKFSRAIYDG
jgi:hypothetical protein